MKDACFLIKRPSVNVVYIYLPGDEEHKRWAHRFVFSINHHRPAISYKFTVICNGPKFDGKEVFAPMGKYDVFHHDDTGWDIGGYIAFSKVCKDDIMYCMGGTAYVRTDAWLERPLESWDKHGPGMHGTLATFEIRPHINTSGFLTTPSLLSAYPFPVATKQHRYEFEHGFGSFWMMVNRAGLQTLLVTHCGEYSWPDWRHPPNIYRRGDQTNLLTHFRHTDNYAAANPQMRGFMESMADTLQDPAFKGFHTPTLPPSLL
jgi:hypothetical protein